MVYLDKTALFTKWQGGLIHGYRLRVNIRTGATNLGRARQVSFPQQKFAPYALANRFSDEASLRKAPARTGETLIKN